MSFILLGFTQQNTIRHFAFLRLAADGTRDEFAVHADIQTARSREIKLQDLPLMCRRLLEAQPQDIETRALILTADDMQRAERGKADEDRLPGRRRQPPRVGVFDAGLRTDASERVSQRKVETA